MPRRLSGLLFVVLCCADCAAVEGSDRTYDSTGHGEDEIAGGTPAAGREPAVVAVHSSWDRLCTGSLVAPDIVLTARHCVATTTGCPSPESLALNPVLPVDPSEVSVTTGDDASAASIPARAVVLPEPFRCEEDLAVVLLAREIEDAFVLPIAREMPAPGALVRLVGYGLDESGAAGAKAIREHVVITRAAGDTFTIGEGACSGDSGGPAIDEATFAIVGVLSNGSAECVGPSAFSVYASAANVWPLIDRVDALR